MKIATNATLLSLVLLSHTLVACLGFISPSSFSSAKLVLDSRLLSSQRTQTLHAETSSSTAEKDGLDASIDSLPVPDEAVVVTPTTTTDGTKNAAQSQGIYYPNNSADEQGMDERIYTFNKVLIDTVYEIICFLYPVRGTDRDYARFYVLETVARVPYFAYLSVLHFRETFGQRFDGQDGMKERMRTHYAEADNEMHHLLIMESLGGNRNGFDRVVAQTMAFFYYWYVIPVFALSEPAAYHLSELIENHAYNTYNKYLTEHEAMLRTKPVPEIAHQYYEEEDPFLFDQFCTVKALDEENHWQARRPKLESLYDVFVNIRDDENEHWKTLCNLVQYNDMHGADSKHVKSTQPVKVAA